MAPPAPSCKFCSVVAGAAPADVVLDEPETVGFLDHRPLFPGHVLVVPRAHHPTLGDLPAPAVATLFLAVQRVTRAVVGAMEADGSFVALNNTVSQSVAHVHVHVVPRRRRDGLRGFFWPRQRYPSAAASARVAEAVRAALASGAAERS